jgi:branched-chain amino acid transport system permease protein
MYDLGILLQIIFWGLYAGCIYILLATGLNLIFGVMKIVNFAHGEFLMIGAYITATIFLLTGFNPYTIILVSVHWWNAYVFGRSLAPANSMKYSSP